MRDMIMSSYPGNQFSGQKVGKLCIGRQFSNARVRTRVCDQHCHRGQYFLRPDQIIENYGSRDLRQIGAFIEDDDQMIGSTHRLVACGKVNRQIVVVLEKFTVYRVLLNGTGCNAVVRNQPGLRSGTWQFCDRLTVEQGRILRTAPPLRVQGIGLHGGESLGLRATEHYRIVDRKAVSKPRCGGKTDGHVPNIRPRYLVHDEVKGMEATTLEGSDKKHVTRQACPPPQECDQLEAGIVGNRFDQRRMFLGDLLPKTGCVRSSGSSQLAESIDARARIGTTPWLRLKTLIEGQHLVQSQPVVHRLR